MPVRHCLCDQPRQSPDPRLPPARPPPTGRSLALVGEALPSQSSTYLPIISGSGDPFGGNPFGDPSGGDPIGDGFAYISTGANALFALDGDTSELRQSSAALPRCAFGPLPLTLLCHTLTGWPAGECASTSGADVRPWFVLDLGGSDLVWSVQLMAHYAVGEAADGMHVCGCAWQDRRCPCTWQGQAAWRVRAHHFAAQLPSLPRCLQTWRFASVTRRRPLAWPPAPPSLPTPCVTRAAWWPTNGLE